ncbi:hypothetical protein [Shouchella shacheensis]|uniref:hypothetical protein n=1 Tax=Shouchella shacheensis TaxID=1649580 RepID=UPI0007400921|nr:hypothetical protein [Shouchella shacheensis]
MNHERKNNPYHQGNQPSMYEQCQRHKDFHVGIQTTDGQSYDGILTDYNQDQLTLLVPEDVEEGEHRQYGGYGGYERRYRRYRPRYFPLAALASLALYPYFYPPYYPPYPYPYYPY